MATKTVSKNTWFREIFGFDEVIDDFDGNKANFKMDSTNSSLECTTAPLEYQKQHVGLFECPSLSELHEMITSTTKAVAPPVVNSGTLTFAHIAAPDGIQALHIDEANKGAVFQVASQFNCLEMASRSIRPSAGITIYSDDPTQGPACAMACPAGTVYRNYFVKHGPTGVNEHGTFEGQKTEQINNLAGVDALLNNTANKYWKMENGYVIPDSLGSIDKLKTYIETHGQDKVKEVENALRVGIHWSTSVTPPNTHNVCQVYASAVPCKYPKDQTPPDHMPLSIDIWEPFARIVLRAAYEATLAVATIHSLQLKKRITCYLTLLGGGEFGNRSEWIRDAIDSALTKFSKYPLDVKLVHRGTTPDKNWTAALLERPDTKLLSSPPPLPPPTDEAVAAAATKAAKDKAAAAGTAKLDPTAALEPTLLLDTTRIPTTLLLLGTSLVKSLLNIQASKQVELKVSDLIEFNSNLSNLPSLKNKETKNKLGDIDKIIDTNINKSEDLQVELAKYNIGITGNSIYIDTQISSNSTKKLPTVSQEELLRGLAKINKLPIFQNPEDIKKILLKIEREQSETTVKRLLEENFNITMTGTKVSIALI
jgi:hypothetical protein